MRHSLSMVRSSHRARNASIASAAAFSLESVGVRYVHRKSKYSGEKILRKKRRRVSTVERLRVLSCRDVEDKIVFGEQSSVVHGSECNSKKDSGGGHSFARLDISRTKRTGVPEAVFCPGKTPAQVALLLKQIVSSDSELDPGSYAAVATRMESKMAEHVCKEIPALRYYPNCNIAVLWRIDMQNFSDNQASPFTKSSPMKCTTRSSDNEFSFVPGDGYVSCSLSIGGSIGIISAGTADQKVALEAKCIAEVYGVRDVGWYCDVGVAGLHRLIRELDSIRRHDVVVVVAGMDGALPSVLAGLIDAPIIAVPTSVGYGANLGGISALLTSLNSCAPGVSVVNIDNGFGAATCAIKILRRAMKIRSTT